MNNNVIKHMTLNKYYKCYSEALPGPGITHVHICAIAIGYTLDCDMLLICIYSIYKESE